MKKIISIFVVCIIVLTGCGNSEDVDGREITHELGVVTIPHDIKNVAVFDYGVLDILDNMEVDVMGVSKNSLPDYLSKYKEDKYTDVGGLKEPNTEELSKMDLDLIIISGRQKQFYDELSKIAPVMFYNTNLDPYLESTKGTISSLGELFDKESKASELNEELQNTFDKAPKSKEEILVVMVSGNEITDFGPESRFGFIYTFGYKPLKDTDVESSHGNVISYEYIAQKNPDKIFIIDKNGFNKSEFSTKELLDNPLVTGTKAAKNDGIKYLDGKIWYFAPGGYTSTLRMIEEMSV